MNFGLAKEIYGGGAWCVDPISFLSLSSILKNIQNGVKLDVPEKKYNSVSFLDLKSATKLIQRDWQLESKDDFEAIGIINLNGPITKGGGASSTGMIELSNMMFSMSKDERVKGFVILTDSGGGASSAVEIMTDTINEIKQTKPVYALVTKGGMAGSAAYGIISAATKIYSEHKMNVVGSVGTMISFEAHKANSESPDGLKHITVYASKSTMKNKAFEEAVNNDNYDLLVSEILDPINENFIEMVGNNRPKLKSTKFDDGHTVYSRDAIGTFIDGIASFKEVVEMVVEESNSNITLNPNINSNSKKMNKAEIKSAHPETYNEILSEGRTAEKERVGSWMAYSKVDAEAVEAGIASGLEISPSQRENFNVKMQQAAILGNLVIDSAKPIVTAESQITETVKTEKDKELESAMDFKL